MSIETDLFDVLGPLVGDRCYPEVFPLKTPVPQWPAIRYSVVSEVPAVMLCGDTGVEANTTRIQLDLVAASVPAVRGLRDSVIAALENFDPPAVRDSGAMNWDLETDTFRYTMDYTFYPST